MTTLSKFFQEHCTQRNCQQLLHTESCRKHLIKDLLLFTISNFKYFAPICLLPVLIKIKSLNKKKLRRALEYYLGCSVMGTLIGYSINLLICLTRFIRGKFGFYSFIFIPTFLGSFPLYLGSSRVINLYETTVFQCTIETFFFVQKNTISRTIANSKIVQTCLFMACSAIILHVKQMYKAPGFWLLSPNAKKCRTDNVEQWLECDLHSQKSCKQYLFYGMRKYFIMGLSLDILKMLLRSVTPNQRKSKFLSKLISFRIRSMAFLTAYVGIYRFIHCWLNRKSFYSDAINHNLSSFLAGSCYFLYPHPTLLSFAIVQGIRSFWKMFEVSSAASQNKILMKINSIPFARITYPFALANLIHLIVLQPKYVSHLATTVASGLTNKYPVEIQHKISLLKAQYK